MKKLFTILILMSVAISAFAVQKALVIGNSAYPSKAISHPVLETAHADTILARFGWQVTRLANLTSTNMKSSIQQFTQDVSASDTVLVVYSGAAIQLDKVNWLVPTGKQFTDAATFKTQAVSLDWMMSQLSKASLRLLFLDGAYQTSSVTFKVSVSGLAAVSKVAPNTLLMYNAPLNTWAASDGGYYNKLLPSLRSRIAFFALPVLDMRQNIINDIANPAGTRGITPPWFLNSIGDAIRVNPPPDPDQYYFRKGWDLYDSDGGGSYSF